MPSREQHTEGVEQCEHCGSKASKTVKYYGRDVPACVDCGALL